MRRAVFTKPALAGGGEAEMLARHPSGAIRRPSGRRFRVRAQISDTRNATKPAVTDSRLEPGDLAALRGWAFSGFEACAVPRGIDDVEPGTPATLGHPGLGLLFSALLSSERTDPIKVLPGDCERVSRPLLKFSGGHSLFRLLPDRTWRLFQRSFRSRGEGRRRVSPCPCGHGLDGTSARLRACRLRPNASSCCRPSSA